MCGGSLITDRHVLTAAHCAINPELVIVRLGEHEIGNDEDGADPIDVAIQDVKIHKEYNPRNYDNDIAILTLEEAVDFNEAVSPICLPSFDVAKTETVSRGRFTGKQPFVAGWGSTKFRGPTSKQLLEIWLTVLSPLYRKRLAICELNGRKIPFLRAFKSLCFRKKLVLKMFYTLLLHVFHSESISDSFP